MLIVSDSAKILKSFLIITCLDDHARAMMLKMVLTFIMHRGRMSCSQAARSVSSDSTHRAQITRFLKKIGTQQRNWNGPLRDEILKLEKCKGEYVFIVDATLVSQAGKKTKNTFSTGNRKRHQKKGRRYNQKKVTRKQCHSFTFGLLITPSGYRIPFQIPHYTKEYCAEKGLARRTTADSAAQLILELSLPASAKVIVLGDTAYDALAVQKACEQRNYAWIVPANPERVYAGPTGQRPKLRSRLKDWKSLSLKTIKLRASTGKYAEYRRLSRWRVGLKTKPRVYYAYQEKRNVRHVGDVKLIFSTMKNNFIKATPDHVKILMTNAVDRSLSEIIELYSIRWQIELLFKELKSTLGFSKYRFQCFEAVEAWAELAITTVLFLEHTRAKKLTDKRQSKKTKNWWKMQRLYGLCLAVHQQCQEQELKYLSNRLKTAGGLKKLKQVLNAALPEEYRPKP